MLRSPICAGTLNPWVIALGVTLQAAPLVATARTRIHLALDHSIRSVDPRQSVDANFLSLEDLIHCSLITFDAEGRPVPGIAAQAPVWTSTQVLEVKVKDGVKFSDGSTLTAEDVAATWRSLLVNPSLARSASVPMLSDVQARGSSVIFTLKEADADFISKLALGILPAKVTQAPSLAFSAMPVCGPYVIKSLDVDHMVLEKNPHALLTFGPRFTQIEFRFLSDEKARFALLEKGEIDFVQNGISRDSVKRLAKNPQLEVIKRPGINTTYIGFHQRDPLAGHPAVREAIAHALNRQEIINQLLGGLAVPANSLMPPGSPFHPKGLQQRPWDPAKAEKILDDAGFKKKGGVRFELSYKTTTDINQINIAKAIASQLKKIGIKIVVQPLEGKTLEEEAQQGRLQLWSLNWANLSNPGALHEAFSSQSVPPHGNNRGWYNNPKLDALLEKGKISSIPEQRLQIYQEAQELLNQDLPYIFLWHEDQFAVVNRALKGFALHAGGRYSALTRAHFDD